MQNVTCNSYAINSRVAFVKLRDCLSCRNGFIFSDILIVDPFHGVFIRYNKLRTANVKKYSMRSSVASSGSKPSAIKNVRVHSFHISLSVYPSGYHSRCSLRQEIKNLLRIGTPLFKNDFSGFYVKFICRLTVDYRMDNA